MIKRVSKYIKKIKTPQRASQASLMRYLNGELFSLEAELIDVAIRVNGEKAATRLLTHLERERNRQALKKKRPTNIEMMKYFDSRFARLHKITQQLGIDVEKSKESVPVEKKDRKVTPVYKQNKES